MHYDELRQNYEDLVWITKTMKEMDATAQQLNEALRDVKHRIRHNRDYGHDDPLETVVWKYGTIGLDNKRHLEDFDDSCSRYRFYQVDYVVEDVQEFIKDNETPWYNPYEDGRDCTGVWFTTHMRVVPIPGTGTTLVIEHQSVDV